MSVNYMLISIVILAVAIAIPFVTFEKKKPKARQIVMIAVMSALTVAANIICACTIPLHAGTALVIISGIAFGPESGFLIGVLSRFVCNFFMGQGMWTPWEMAAWGILGALAGIAFYKPEISGHFDDKKEIMKKKTQKGLSYMAVPVVGVYIYCHRGRDFLWMEALCLRACRYSHIGDIDAQKDSVQFRDCDNIYICKRVCNIWRIDEYRCNDDEQHSF